MLKFIFTALILFTTFLQASLINTAFIQNDLKVLDELDIDQSYITDYQLQRAYKNRLRSHSKKDYTTKLNNAYLFVPQIKKILKENNIPSSFLYLVMAESNFILHAKSKKKAMGLWQFMPYTGRKFELTINAYIDERMDVVKSTQAAVKYLQYLHKMFGKWYVAAIAYNCGEGRIIEGITRATLDMQCDDIGLKQCRKTKNVSQYRRTIRDYQAKRVKFKELYKIYRVVKKWKYKPDINQLLLTQKGLRRQYIPTESRGYIRKIITLAMMNNSEFLILDDNSHLLNRGISDPIATVQVKGGIELKSIAKIIGITEKKLKSLNKHIKQNIIPLENKTYNIHLPYSKLARFNSNKHNMKKAIFDIYIVKSGDTLAGIAKKYNIRYSNIKSYNKLKSNFLKIKQKLIIPVIASYFKKQKIHYVKRGDNISKIAKLYNISVKKLMNDNNLKTSMIHIGDKLVLKYN